MIALEFAACFGRMPDARQAPLEEHNEPEPDPLIARLHEHDQGRISEDGYR